MNNTDAAKTRFAKALHERRYNDAAMIVFELLAAVVESNNPRTNAAVKLDGN